MTRYKEYLRAKGVKLESDYGTMPSGDVRYVEPWCKGNYIGYEVGHVASDTKLALCDRHGVLTPVEYTDERVLYPENGYTELMDWLFDNGFDNYSVCIRLCNYALSIYHKTYTIPNAFLHVRAGMMHEDAFYKLVSDRYQRVLSNPFLF